MDLFDCDHEANWWEKGHCAMSHTPVGGHPQGWDHKLADRSSLPPASGEERHKTKQHVFTQPHKHYGGSRSECTSGPEGSSGSTPASDSDQRPAYLRWARTLYDLLEDEQGVCLFREFVESAGGLHLDRLNFYFAVHGLRQETEPSKIRQVVSAIYKFLRKSQLTMPPELRTYVKQCLKDENSVIDKTIFDAIEQEVTRTIMETTYPAFLRSELYVTYVSAATQPLHSPSDEVKEFVTSISERGGPSSSSRSRQLGTLHEGRELTSAGGSEPPRLTRDLLIATQARRLQPDAAWGRWARTWCGNTSVAAANPHLSYSGYCPASRRDSERASLSSGRADSDTFSMSSATTIESLNQPSMSSSTRHSRRSMRHHHAYVNRDPDSAMVIPRTQRVQSEQLRVLPPSEFAPLLIEKLEKVRRDQENKEKLDRKLMEGEEDVPSQIIPPQMVAAAIREKLQLDDDNDQSILDEHVSRVWSERTPGGSPPTRCRRRPPSTLSADSGLVDVHPHPRRSISRKTVTEMTDSGVSVVSEGTSAASVEPRILMWIQEGNESSRHGRRSYLSSRTSSAERRGLSPDRAPPLPAPHVLTQLDEARRRLTHRTHVRTAAPRTASGSTNSASVVPEQCTIVVMTFLDETMPYRIKVPHSPLTLRIFKDYLPKKGNYRYFFKTECAELDNQVIQEEISNDSELLPMYDGKVMARVTAA